MNMTLKTLYRFGNTRDDAAFIQTVEPRWMTTLVVVVLIKHFYNERLTYVIPVYYRTFKKPRLVETLFSFANYVQLKILHMTSWYMVQWCLWYWKAYMVRGCTTWSFPPSSHFFCNRMVYNTGDVSMCQSILKMFIRGKWRRRRKR